MQQLCRVQYFWFQVEAARDFNILLVVTVSPKIALLHFTFFFIFIHQLVSALENILYAHISFLVKRRHSEGKRSDTHVFMLVQRCRQLHC